MKHINISLIFLSLFIQGCASLNREDCLRGAWYDLGVKDGRAGSSLSRLQDYQHDCAEYGVQVNRAEYQQGRARGLDSYCRLSNAIDTGLRGNRYQQGVCPANIDARFDDYNYTAYQVYRLKEDVRSLENSIDSKRYDINENNNKLNNTNMADIQKKQNKLNKELRNLENQRSRKLDELTDRERDLNELFRRIGY